MFLRADNSMKTVDAALAMTPDPDKEYTPHKCVFQYATIKQNSG